MSGGSWDYAYSQIADVARRLMDDRDANRRALGKLLDLCADAMYKIEWVDSGDCAPGDEDAAIAKALGAAPELVLSELLSEAKIVVVELGKAIERAEVKP